MLKKVGIFRACSLPVRETMRIRSKKIFGLKNSGYAIGLGVVNV